MPIARMAAPLLIAFGVAGATTAAAGLSAVELESRNAASSFVATLKFAVGRAARNCRDLLGKDDPWMHAIVTDWMSRNSRFANAAETWISIFVTGIANTRGKEAANEAAREITRTVRESALQTVTTFIGETPEAQKLQCESYAQTVASGKYDIPTSAPIYPELLALVAVFEEPAPASTAGDPPPK